MAEKNFETSVNRLEEIVKLLEAGNASLDESVKLYEEGLSLAKLCSEKLEGAKQKLTMIDDYLKENSDD